MKGRTWFRGTGRSGRRQRDNRRLRLDSARRLRCEPLEQRTLLSLTPQLVADLNPGAAASDPRFFCELSGAVYFADTTATSGRELWRSDGTAAGTSLLKDINPGADNSAPAFLTNVNGTMFFSAGDGTHGYELWKSDGTAAGTALVRDSNPGIGSAGIHAAVAAVGSTFFYVAYGAADGYELWRSDGTAAGTMIVKDIYAGPTGSTPTYLTNVNGTLFWSANDGTHGKELWKSDGTAAGTALVKDIYAGSSGSNPAYLFNVNGVLFFQAGDNVNGFELWKSDGTAAGTMMVKDICPGIAASSPRGLANVGGTLFFRAWDSTHGWELWKSDGTDAGTVLVKDINPGSLHSTPRYLTDVGGTLFFVANDGANGDELWQSDGTDAGTVLVKDINAGSASSSPKYLTNVGGLLFFQANDGSHGKELWKSDGTAAGTVMVGDIYPGVASSYPRFLAGAIGSLFFNANDGTHGAELWKVDTGAPTDIALSASSVTEHQPPGTVVGNLTTADSDAGDTFTYSLVDAVTYPDNAAFAIAGNELRAAQTFDYETKNCYTIRVRSTDSEGFTLDKTFTIAVTSVNQPPTDILLSSTSLPENQPSGTVVGNLSATDPSSGETFTFALVDTATYPDNAAFAVVASQFRTAQSFDYEAKQSYTIRLRTTDSTGLNFDKTFSITITNVNEAPTDITISNSSVLEDQPPDTTVGNLSTTDPDSGDAFSYQLVDTATYPDNAAFAIAGSQLRTAQTLDYETKNSYTIRIRSTDSGGLTLDKTFVIAVHDSYPVSLVPQLVADINPLPENVGSSPSQFCEVSGKIFFRANDGTTGYELWKSDGTAAGTVLVKDICAGSSGSSPSNLANIGGTLFFSANDGANGVELWKSDGTAAGTVMVKNISAGVGSSSPSSLTNVGGTLFFVANDGSQTELWKSDGTQAGTVMVKDIYVGGSSTPKYLVNMGGTLFFSANDGTNGIELWKSDGTAAGTVMVKDIRPGSGSSSPATLVNMGGTLFFSANDGTVGTELWKSDGTAAGTALVKDAFPGAYSLGPSQLTPVGGTLFFEGYDWNGRKLWKSDGTAAGTAMISSSPSYPYYLTNVNGTLYFVPFGGAATIWKSDGTAAGTVQIKQIGPGNGYWPGNLTNVAGMLFFTGNDGTHGTELWRSDGTAAGTVQVADIASPGNSSPGGLISVGNRLFFAATDDAHGRELWTCGNPSPTDIAISTATAPENQPAGTTVGTFSTTDPNAGDLFTYSLVDTASYPDNAAFAIAGNELHTAQAFDYEVKSAYTIRVCSTDSEGLTVRKTFTITVTNLNESPTNLSLSNASVLEDQPSGTAVGNLSATDPDAGDSFSYSLVDTASFPDNAAFAIVGNQLRTAQILDFDAQASYTIRLRTTDSGSLSFDKTCTITVLGLHAPTDIALSGSTVAENQPSGTVIGSLSTTDVDTGNTFTYSLVDTAAWPDNAAFAIVGNQLRTAQAFDYEARSAYTTRIRTTDSTGLSFDKTFAITVTPVDERPTNLSLSNSSLPENQPAGTAIGTMSTSDPDAGDSFVYSLVDTATYPDNAAFAIAGNELRAAQTFDYEAKSTYTIRIRSIDSGGLSFDKTFTITVTNLNDAPTNLSLSNSSVAENRPAGTAVGSLSTSDPDAGDSFTYSLVDTATWPDNAAFAIVGNQLRTAQAFDYEARSAYTIRIRTTDSTGLSFDKTFSIAITNVNEAPTDLSLSASFVPVNRPSGTLVATLGTSDPDVGNTFTYALVAGDGGADNGLFSISGNTLRTAAPLDIQHGSYSIRIRTTDSGGLWYEKAVTLQPALSGDATVDGHVDVNDLGVLLANYSKSGMTWGQGDFTGDGSVTIDDLSQLVTNYNKSVGAANAPAGGTGAEGGGAKGEGGRRRAEAAPSTTSSLFTGGGGKVGLLAQLAAYDRVLRDATATGWASSAELLPRWSSLAADDFALLNSPHQESKRHDLFG